jgi:small subunit ribosomal protein S11
MFAVIQEKLEEEKGKLKAANPWTSVVDDPKNPPFRVDMFFKGFGTGREALYRAMLTAQGDVVRPIVSSITDRTAIKIGGTRAKKRKRQ